MCFPGAKAVWDLSRIDRMFGDITLLSTLATVLLSVLLTEIGRVLSALPVSSLGKKKRLVKLKDLLMRPPTDRDSAYLYSRGLLYQLGVYRQRS